MTIPTVSAPNLLARDLCNDGRGARARAAALASRDEHHVRFGKRLANFRTALLCSLATDLWIRSGAEASRQLLADVDRLVGIRHEQRLSIGVHGNEFDAAHPRFDHAVHGIRAAAAYADDLDDRQMLGTYFVWHCFLHTSCVFKCCVSLRGYSSRAVIVHDDQPFANYAARMKTARPQYETGEATTPPVPPPVELLQRARIRQKAALEGATKRVPQRCEDCPSDWALPRRPLEQVLKEPSRSDSPRCAR